MFARCSVRGLLLLCLGSSLVGCNNQGLNSVQVTPATQALAVGQTVQFTAVGTYGNSKNLTTQNITTSVTWASSVPSVATVSASGIATAVGAGSTTITASATGWSGHVSSSATLVVSGSGSGGGTGGGGGGSILSLTIIPSGIVFGSLTSSGQFLAIGTFSAAPTVRDLTNSVKWLTSAPNIFPITNYSSSVTGTGTQNGGVVSAYGASVGNVGATITAEATDSNGALATATASVGCPFKAATAPTPPTATSPGTPGDPGTCNEDVLPLLSTLTVYNEGLNPNTPEQGGNWLLTAPSATCNPAVPATCTPVITCGPGAGAGKSVCTATYPVGTTVTLTAPAQSGVKFGGWSSNCANTGTITQTGPNTCTVTLLVDATVGAIFN